MWVRIAAFYNEGKVDADGDHGGDHAALDQHLEHEHDRLEHHEERVH